MKAIMPGQPPVYPWVSSPTRFFYPLDVKAVSHNASLNNLMKG